MIDSAQKRSSASRLGTLSVYRPVGAINSAQNRINQAWWYAGIILPTDNFFFWRADSNDGQPFVTNLNPDFAGQQDSDSSTAWGSPSVSSGNMIGESRPSTSWSSDSQIYDRN